MNPNNRGNGSIGAVITMGDLPTYGSGNSKKKDAGHYKSRINWKVEIRKLMRDFNFSKETIDGIIRTTEAECKKDSASDKYNYAWRKFWALLSY